ncbi:MAG: hypothetical protein ACUVXI_06240 [bacterium]
MRLGIAYLGSYLPQHLDMDLEDIKNMGCDDVVITLAENDFRILTGKVRFAAKIAHDHGLRIIANFWGYACAFGGGRVSKLLTERPDVWQVDRDGNPVGMGCPNNETLRENLVRMVEECLEYEYDGFFWDEPTKYNCYCKSCQSKYEAKYGHPLPKEDTAELREFREESIADFVNYMSDKVKELDPTKITSTCVMPTDRESWESVASIPSLDIFGTDPYWLCFKRDLSFVSESAREIVKICRKYGKTSNLWVQCWKVPQSKEGEVYEASLLCAREKPDSIYAWSYMGGLGSNEECDDPSKAWENLKRAYREIREKEAR